MRPQMHDVTERLEKLLHAAREPAPAPEPEPAPAPESEPEPGAAAAAAEECAADPGSLPVSAVSAPAAVLAGSAEAAFLL